MVLVVDYQQKENTEGKIFFTLIVQGQPELVISQKGKPYLTARKASLSTTFNDFTCRQMIGKELPGEITETPCEPYEITTEVGEVITKHSRNEYQLEEVVKGADEAVFTMQENPFR